MTDYDAERAKLDQFMSDNGIKLTMTYMGIVDNPVYEPSERLLHVNNVQYHKYRCTLTGPGGRTQVYWYAGTGISPSKIKPSDVFNSLYIECGSAEVYGTDGSGLWDYMADMAYTNEAKGKRAYWGIAKQALAMQRIMGEEVYQQFIELDVEL